MEPRKSKQIIFGKDVREKIDRGLEIAYRAVTATLGSKGRNVAYEMNWGFPGVIHDGVTVARELVLKDPYENMAAQLVIAAAQKTNDEAGDGTTTCTAIIYGIAHEALQIVAAGTNPAIIRKGIEKAVDAVLNELKILSKPITTHEEMAQIATISAADKEMGDLIATAVQTVGKNGIVTVQPGATDKVEVEYKEGMDFPSGYISPWLMNDTQRLEAVYQGTENNAIYVVIINEKVNNDKLVSLLEPIYQYDLKAQVLVIADDYEQEAIASIVMTKNNPKGKKALVAVKSPEFGDHRTNMLNDIAILTGGTVLGGTGLPLDQASIESYGRTDKVVVDARNTQIIGAHGKKKDIKDRVAAIRNLMEKAPTEFARDKLESRQAKLAAGVGIISVGAPSEAEMNEKKERVIDAVNAVRAAIAEGVVPGGGVALLRARRAIDKLKIGKQQVGADIVKAALAYPIKKLISNAGVEKVDHIIGTIEDSKNINYGYNVDTEEYVDLLETGIIDPLKVARCALVNAASIATMLITTDVMIVFEREKVKTNMVDDTGIGDFPD